MATVNDPPEFAISERDKYNVANPSELGPTTFMTAQEAHELPPQTTDNVLNYLQYHQEQEPWAIFRALPELIKYDKALADFFRGLSNGSLHIPNWMAQTNPASVWAYYLTLPTWCRDHPVIYNMVHAFEYHQPMVDIRKKELGMNYACSFLKPIEGRLRDVIIEVAASKKIRLNIELGKQMISELRFFELRPEELGETASDEEGDKGENALVNLLGAGVQDDKMNSADIKQQIEKLIGGQDYVSRMKERERILGQEQNIDKFQFEAATEEIMDDYIPKKYADVDSVEAAETAQHEPQIPCNYYENDDGFWDDYIDWKQQRWQDAGMITHRKFFKH